MDIPLKVTLASFVTTTIINISFTEQFVRMVVLVLPKGNKWGIFGSVGAAWAITNEDFMKDVKWLKNLKYKLSWGVLGNQDFYNEPELLPVTILMKTFIQLIT